jgi:predicted anti-sigma-YlaC factor YlaD
MECRDTVHLICWYLEGKLSPSVEREIERHLNRCRECRLVLEAATKTVDQHLERETSRFGIRPVNA